VHFAFTYGSSGSPSPTIAYMYASVGLGWL
jgi:hypothetical protein